MKSVSGTMLATASAKIYRAVGRAVKNIEVGSLVSVGFARGVGKASRKEKPVVGVVMGRQYLAYDPKFCKWRVMVGDEMRVIRQSNLSLLETG